MLEPRDILMQTFFRAVYRGGCAGDIDGHVRNWAQLHIGPIIPDDPALAYFQAMGHNLYLSFGDRMGSPSFDIPAGWRAKEIAHA